MIVEVDDGQRTTRAADKRGGQMVIIARPDEGQGRLIVFRQVGQDAGRPTKEPRVLNAMAPAVREDYLKLRNEIDSTGSGPVADEGLKSTEAA